MTVLLPSRNNHMRKCFIYFFENNGKASSDQREIVLYLLKKKPIEINNDSKYCLRKIEWVLLCLNI
jgi:hypothetical protein